MHKPSPDPDWILSASTAGWGYGVKRHTADLHFVFLWSVFIHNYALKKWKILNENAKKEWDEDNWRWLSYPYKEFFFSVQNVFGKKRNISEMSEQVSKNVTVFKMKYTKKQNKPHKTTMTKQENMILKN